MWIKSAVLKGLTMKKLSNTPNFENSIELDSKLYYKIIQK